MSSFDEIRSSLLKKYNVSAAGTSGSTNTQTAVTQEMQPNTDTSDFYTIRSNLLDKYSPEKTTERQNAVDDWATRFNNAMQGISNPSSKSGNWYTRSAIDSFGSDIDSLIRDYDSIKDYAGRLGLPNAQRYLKQLQEVQRQIQRENGWYQKYQGSGHNEIETVLSRMAAGDERNWLEDNRYDVYKTSSDYQQRVQSGMDAFKASKPKDLEEESWFDAVARYLGKASDTTMALGDTGRMAQEYRKDTSYQEPADNWTEDQRNTYGYLYSINPKAASDFAVKTSENYRRTENQQKIGAVQEWATKNGVNASAGTVAAIAMMPLSLADTLNALTEYNARGTISTPSSPTPGQVSEAITGAVGQSLNDKHGTISSKIPVIGGKGWGDAYQLGTSIANSLLSAYTQGSVGTDILFFGSAASSSMYSAKDRGATDEQAIKLGVLSGLAEAAGEHFSIEGLIGMSEANTMKAFFGNVLKQSGIEASEEGFTTLMNNFADQLIMGKDSAFYEKVRTYMFENGMSEQEAKKQAWKDMAEDLAFDMVGGAISGGVSTGIQTGAQKIFGGTQQVQTHHESFATDKEILTTELANSEENATADNAEAVTEESSAADYQMSATEESAENATTTVGVSKMETVQVKPDMDSFAQQFGTQAEAVKRNYLEGQDLQEYEVGFQTAYAMGLEGGKAEALTKVPYLSQSQREIAFSMGRDAAAAQNTVTTTAGNSATTETPAASDAAQAVQISTGTPVEISRISNVDGNGGITYELADGRTVNADDIQHAQSGEAVLYETVAELGASAEVSNKLVDAWKNDTAGVSAESYAAGMADAFNYGRYNIPEVEMAQNEAIQHLTANQRNTAYQLGKAYGREIAQAKETKIHNTGAVPKAQNGSGAAVQQTAAPRSDGESAAAPTRTGKVHFDRQSRTLSAVQETGLKTMEQLSQLFGSEFHVFESYEKDGKRVFRDENGVERDAPNGWYDPETGHIHIDLNAGSGGSGTMLFTVAHELTHFIRDWSPAKFDKLAEAVIELVYKENDISVIGLIREQQAKALRTGREISFDEAYEEVVADSMESILTSGNVVEFMAQVKQKDQTLWEKIREWFKNLAEDIRKLVQAYSGHKPDSPEGRAVASMKDMLPVLEGFYADALQEASANFQAAESRERVEHTGGRKYSYAGEHARTADLDQLATAKAMQQEGVSNETIRQQTGWFMGRDGKWRFEIDDSRMKYHRAGDALFSEMHPEYARHQELMQKWLYGELEGKEESEFKELDEVWGREHQRLSDRVRWGNATLQNILHHDELFEAYPELRGAKVTFEDMEDWKRGQYDPNTNTITLSNKLRNAPQETLLHEVQHAIQSVENFTGGASVEYWKEQRRDIVETIAAARKNLDLWLADIGYPEVNRQSLLAVSRREKPFEQHRKDMEEFKANSEFARQIATCEAELADFQRQYDEITHGMTVYDQYENTSGEIEARDTANRWKTGLDAEGRKNTPPDLGDDKTVFAEGNVRSEQAKPSLKNPDKLDPKTVTREDVWQLLNNVKSGKYGENTYIPVRISTPGIVQERLFAENLPMAMPVKKVQQAFKADSGQVKGKNIRGHGLTVDDLLYVIENLDSPDYLFAQDNDRGVAVIKLPMKFNNTAVVVEFGDNINAPYMNGYDGGKYNLTITAFEVDNGDVGLFMYQMDKGWRKVFDKEKEGDPAKKFQATRPFAIEQDSLETIVTHGINEVNRKFSHRDPLQEKAAQALETENQRLREDVKGLKDLVKLQGKVTGGKIMNPSSIEKAARVLKKNADANGDTKELAQLLTDFYSYISGSPDLPWEGVKEAAQKAADWLWENRREEVDEYSAEILQDLRTRSISLSDSQKAEASVTHDTFANYRKAMFGSVKITENGMPLDEAWHELSGLYPGVFPEDTNSGDMPRALVDIVARLRSSDGTYMGYDEIMARQSLIRDVYDSYWSVSTLYTVADVKQKEINALKSRHAQRMSDLRTKHREKVEQLHMEQKAAVDAVRAAERQRSQERTKKALDKHRENQKQVAANRAERREKTEVRRKIRKAVMELDKLLNRGDKKKNVKSGMTSMVDSVLKLADALFMDEYTNRDMLRNGVGVELTDAEETLFREAQQILQQTESGAAIEGMEFTSEVDAMNQLKKLDQKLSSKMAGLKDVFARERKRLYGTTVSDLLGKLADEYSRLSEAENGAVRAAKDENVYAHLLQLQKDVGGTTVRDMTLNQMEAVADAFTMVLTTVRNANKMFAKNLKFKRDTLAAMVMGEIGAAVKKISKLIRPGKNAVDTFSWNNLKPVYAFERLGSETLKTLYQNIRSGQDVWSRDMQEADDFRREQYRKHNRKAWNLEKQHRFEFESGIVELSLEQIMSLYAYSRREQALDHLLKGGFVFSGSTEVMVKEPGIQRRYLKKDATAYNLTADELLQVVDTLTKEQKAFVEDMQTYLSDVMGGKGNEISLQMYGIKSYGEKNYFPIRSAGQYMERAKEDSFRKEQGQISIVNSGFTKSTTPKANNPITLDGFMNVWAEHVNEMSMYHGFALPMEDFRRVYNYSSPNMEVGNSQSVNAVIENAFGKAATGYIDQLYKDLNGGAVSDNRENLSKKLVGLHKKAAVFASASVVVQQPSAIVRAFALIDPRHFIGPKVDRKRHKQLWEEVKKYAPVAFVKEMGYFDTGMGRSARDFLQAEEYSGIREKMTALFKDADYRDEILGKAPALADELTWCSIWEAVKRETKAKNPDLDVRSDAFLQIAGERFSEVIDKTQVYDSVLSRSANMRSKSGLMNMVTSFMAEPTTSINMLEDALRSGDRQQLKRTVGAVYGSVLLNSLLVSLVYAARDDDEDETWWEKYLSSVAVEMVDGINPITYYPFLRDVWSIGQGFDVERADMSLITDFADAAKKVVQSILKVQQAEADEQPAAIGALKDSLWGMTDTVASLTGLPVKNIRRDISGAVNLYRTISTDLSGRQTTFLSLQDTVLADVMGSIPIGNLLYSKNKRQKLYDAIVAGDASYVQRLKAGYDSEDSYHTAIKQALRDYDSRIWEAANAWNSGDMDTYIRIAKEIRDENRFDQDDIVLAIRSEANSMLNNEGSSADKVYGYFTAEKFGVAIGQNNTAMADMIRKDLIDTAMANGKTRDEAEDSFRSTARSKVKQLFADGTITGSNAQKLLVKYGDYDQADATDRVAEWQYEKDHPELDGRITYTQYKRWEADGKSRGVALDTFTDVAEYQDSGTSGSNRSQAEVADYINRLPISTAQKDALWCCFWKESTLYKNAPWA